MLISDVQTCTFVVAEMRLILEICVRLLPRIVTQNKLVIAVIDLYQNELTMTIDLTLIQIKDYQKN